MQKLPTDPQLALQLPSIPLGLSSGPPSYRSGVLTSRSFASVIPEVSGAAAGDLEDLLPPESFLETLARPLVRDIWCACIIRPTSGKLWSTGFSLFTPGQRTVLWAEKKKTGLYVIHGVSNSGALTPLAEVRKSVNGSDYSMTVYANDSRHQNRETLALNFNSQCTYEQRKLRHVSVRIPCVDSPQPGGVILSARKPKDPDTHGVETLISAAPILDPLTKKYVLRFRSQQIKHSSSRNVQLTRETEPESVVMELGKMDAKSFSLNFSYPLSPIQAFAISLSLL